MRLQTYCLIFLRFRFFTYNLGISTPTSCDYWEDKIIWFHCNTRCVSVNTTFLLLILSPIYQNMLSIVNIDVVSSERTMCEVNTWPQQPNSLCANRCQCYAVLTLFLLMYLSYIYSRPKETVFPKVWFHVGYFQAEKLSPLEPFFHARHCPGQFTASHRDAFFCTGGDLSSAGATWGEGLESLSGKLRNGSWQVHSAMSSGSATHSGALSETAKCTEQHWGLPWEPETDALLHRKGLL